MNALILRFRRPRPDGRAAPPAACAEPGCDFRPWRDGRCALHATPAPRRRAVPVTRPRPDVLASLARAAELVAGHRWAAAERALAEARRGAPRDVVGLVDQASRAVAQYRLLNAAAAPPGEKWETEQEARRAIARALALVGDVALVRGAA